MPTDRRCGVIGNFKQADPFRCKIQRQNEAPIDELIEDEQKFALSEVPVKDEGDNGKPSNILNNSFPEFVPITETNNPCYLPQPNDLMLAKDNQEPMGPVGPWATGKVDWAPLAGLTGTRPVVDRYSITRFSGAEWREHNRALLSNVSEQCLASLRNDNKCKNVFNESKGMAIKNQADNNRLLTERAQLVNKWKMALERSISAMIEEISFLTDDLIKVKQSLTIFEVPESIAKECLEKRCGRPETELVRDEAEELLIKELAQIGEIRALLMKTLSDIKNQLIENRTARHRLEYDWSDKKDAYEIGTANVALNDDNKTIMFYPGSVNLPTGQSSKQYWEHFTFETLEECEKCRQRSVDLRSTLDDILMTAAKELRHAADQVEAALTSRINCMTECVQRMENDLRDTLQKLADTENRIEWMSQNIRGFDNSMKVAQTRLNDRSYRPHVENCRDEAQFGLVEEVHSLHSSVTRNTAMLNEAEACKRNLVDARGKLEREIMLKRRCLMIDRDRCMVLRSHFPSSNALSGFASL
ncbi:hypothetical protein ACFFRR_005120 [Megaselia abdita]